MKKISLKDDFYQAINQEWLDKAKIPADRPSTGAFYEIHKKSERRLKLIANSLLKEYKSKKLENNVLTNFAKLYEMTSNFEKREQLGIKPLKELVKEIEKIQSLEDYAMAIEKHILYGLPTFLNFFVYQDFKNSEIQTLYLSSPKTLLPETSYYDEKNPAKVSLLNAYRKMQRKLLKKYGYNSKKIETLLTQAINFDERLAKYYPSGQELADYDKMYNPMHVDEVNAKIKYFDVKTLLEKLVNQSVDIVSPTYPRFLDNINEVLNSENFEEFKAWLLLSTISSFSPYLDNDSRVNSSIYGRTLSGVKKASKKEKAALNIAISAFNMPVGLYYANKYFSESAKKDVENKIAKMINVYARRLEANTWLTKATKEKALIKLRGLGVHVGYPTEIRPYYQAIEIKSYKEGGNLVKNILEVNYQEQKYMFSNYKQPINKNYWSMSPAVVNAYYSPTMNHIVFPAAILDAPFYSEKQTSSQNYGGIGAVIAHEISHAFDNHGALFDEKGNKNMWWTEQDFAKFQGLGQKMIDLFEGVETGVGLCNGKLTLSENIADGGGISCALEASKSESNHSSKEFFTNWAIVWRNKASESYRKILLSTDPHAPAKLRANQQVKNLDDFYETFDIKEGDGMFLPKEKRVNIW